MCDKIKESDIKYQKSQEKVGQDGCLGQNAILTECLKANNSDWRKCNQETDNLKNCIMNAKMSSNQVKNAS